MPLQLRLLAQEEAVSLFTGAQDHHKSERSETASTGDFEPCPVRSTASKPQPHHVPAPLAPYGPLGRSVQPYCAFCGAKGLPVTKESR